MAATPQRNRIFERGGYAAFFIFALTLFWGPAGPYLMLVPLLAYFIYFCRRPASPAARSPLVWLAWIFVLYAAVSAVTGFFNDPSTAAWQEKVVADFFRIGGFWAVLLAPWLTGAAGPRNRYLLFGLALFGFVAESIGEIPWRELGETSLRTGLVSGPNSSAVVAGVFFFLVLIVGATGLVHLAQRRHPALTAAVGLAWLALLAILVVYLVITQSRSAWIALVAVLALLGVALAYWTIRYGNRRQRQGFFGVATATVLLLTAVGISQSHIFERRIEAAQPAIEKIVTGKLDELERGSISYRIWLYQFGLSKVPDKPLFGWSAGGIKALIHDHAPDKITKFNQVHNMHLEILLALGLVGFALFYAMVTISFVEVGWAMRARRLPVEWGTFWMAATLFMGIEALFDTRYFVYEYGATMALLGATGIACQLDRLRRSPRPATEQRQPPTSAG